MLAHERSLRTLRRFSVSAAVQVTVLCLGDGRPFARIPLVDRWGE